MSTLYNTDAGRSASLARFDSVSRFCATLRCCSRRKCVKIVNWILLPTEDAGTESDLARIIGRVGSWREPRAISIRVRARFC